MEHLLDEFQLIQKALQYSYNQLEQEVKDDTKGMEQLAQANMDLSNALSYFLQRKLYE